MALNWIYLTLVLLYYLLLIIFNPYRLTTFYLSLTLLKISLAFLNSKKDNNVLIEFYHNCCHVMDKSIHKILLVGAHKDGLYQLDHAYLHSSKSSLPQCSSFTASSNYPSSSTVTTLACIASFCDKDTNVWHRELGHACNSTLFAVLQTLHILFQSTMLQYCDACL